jgi:hypothetical protein
MNIMKKITPVTLVVFFFLLAQACSPSEGNETGSDAMPHNTLSDEELADGWKLLFDGENMDAWRGYNLDRFPDRGWKVENGELIVLHSDGSEEGFGGDIITKEKYENFIFELEWNVSERGNSGIFYSVLEQPAKRIFWSAPEMQILDDANYDVGDKWLSGGLYDLIAPDPMNARPPGEWNQIRIVVDHPRVEHWQNGKKVVSYERWTADWFEMVRNSKFECHPEFGAVRNGHIGLQDHGSEVRFRNIKIKKLD